MMPAILAIEVLIFGLTGSTPGKALLGILVVTVGCTRVSLREYAGRLVGLYWHGLGTGFPLVSLFTMARQAGRLKAGQHAAYDQGRFNVKAAKLGFVRGAFAIVVVVSVFVLNGVLQHWAREADHKLATSLPWTNPTTGMRVQLPSGWLPEEQKNGQGATVHVFSAPSQKIVAVFASEDVSGDLSLSEYAALWRRAVAGDMDIHGSEVRVAGAPPSWEGRGHMVDDPSQQVEVSLVQDGRLVWRVVLIGLGQAPSQSPEALRLRGVLLSSLPERWAKTPVAGGREASPGTR